MCEGAQLSQDVLHQLHIIVPHGLQSCLLQTLCTLEDQSGFKSHIHHQLLVCHEKMATVAFDNFDKIISYFIHIQIYLKDIYHVFILTHYLLFIYLLKQPLIIYIFICRLADSCFIQIQMPPS